MATRALNTLDKLYIYGESREVMMYVAGLIAFILRGTRQQNLCAQAG